ncbi:MAG: hypothetical protein ACJ8KO_02795 [Sulfurifustaceae bacterium]
MSARAKPKLGQYIEKLHDALTDLADEYRKVGERHATEHDLYHLCHTLAKQCEGQAEALRPHASRHAADVPGDVDDEPRESMLAGLRRATAALVGRSSATGLLVLRDLRQLHLAIEEAAMLWLIVGQGAQAARDRELLVVVEHCREEITHQVMWIQTRIKETAPQVLVS